MLYTEVPAIFKAIPFLNLTTACTWQLLLSHVGICSDTLGHHLELSPRAAQYIVQTT